MVVQINCNYANTVYRTFSGRFLTSLTMCWLPGCHLWWAKFKWMTGQILDSHTSQTWPIFHPPINKELNLLKWGAAALRNQQGWLHFHGHLPPRWAQGNILVLLYLPHHILVKQNGFCQTYMENSCKVPGTNFDASVAVSAVSKRIPRTALKSNRWRIRLTWCPKVAERNSFSPSSVKSGFLN